MRHPFHLAEVVAADEAAISVRLDRLMSDCGDPVAQLTQLAFDAAGWLTARRLVIHPALDAAGRAAFVTRDDDRVQRCEEALAAVDHVGALDRRDAGALVASLDAEFEHLHANGLDREVSRLGEQIGDRGMEQLGRAYVAAQRRAPTRAHPHVPASLAVNAPVASFDRLRDAISGRAEARLTDASWMLDGQNQLLVDTWASLVPASARELHLLEPTEVRGLPDLADAAVVLLEIEGRAGPQNPLDLVQDHRIDGPGGELVLRVYEPASGAGVRTADGGGLPVYVHVHGGLAGGGVTGGLDQADALCRSLARHVRCLVASVEYRLAPEHPFPAGHDDVLAALRWTISRAGDLDGDPLRVAVGGEGLGATMALAAAVACSREVCRPAGVVMVTPLTSTSSDWPSMVAASDARPMSSALARWTLGHLVDRAADLADPRLDLGAIAASDLSALPPTMVITAERDPWRDQGVAFAGQLRRAGVTVHHVDHLGVAHGFVGCPDVLDRAAAAQAQLAAALCRVFDPTDQWTEATQITATTTGSPRHGAETTGDPS